MEPMAGYMDPPHYVCVFWCCGRFVRNPMGQPGPHAASTWHAVPEPIDFSGWIDPIGLLGMAQALRPSSAQRIESLLQICLMHERVGAFASGQFHQLIGFMLATVLVYIAAQPIQQGNVGALIHAIEGGTQCASCRSKELG